MASTIMLLVAHRVALRRAFVFEHLGGIGKELHQLNSVTGGVVFVIISYARKASSHKTWCGCADEVCKLMCC
jgi:hypothetical protein